MTATKSTARAALEVSMFLLGGDELQESGWTATEPLAVPAVRSPCSSHFIEGDSERGWKHTGSVAERHDTMEEVLCQEFHKGQCPEPR